MSDNRGVSNPTYANSPDDPELGKALRQDDEIDREGRETWGGRFDFMMSLIGFSVGVGNIWRFPNLCFKNGGGAFLIPYFITLFCAGIPLLFFEVSLGQFMSRSDIAAWDICPVFRGVGYATTVIVWYLMLYYIIIITWAIYYIYASVRNGLDEFPWEQCDDTWKISPKQSCFNDLNFLAQSNATTLCKSLVKNGSNEAYIKAGCTQYFDWKANTSLVTTSELFWENDVLGLTDSMDEIGNLQWGLVISLIIGWILCYVCIIGGVRVTGKIVWFTALFPYVMLTALFIRGITLEGAAKGIEFYLKPDFGKLSEGSVWLDAGTQIFWSMSIGLGALPALGSYNNYRHNCLRDCIIYTCVNSGTSIFGGFAIFSILGHMADAMGVSVEDVAKGGPGLTFIAYPKALSLMTVVPQFWAVCFFLMIMFLGLDSQFVSVEGFIAQVMDAFPQFFRFRHARKIFVTVVTIISGCVGLIFVTQGGMYYFQIMDFYSASGMTLLFVSFFEVVGIAYFYGGFRYVRDLEAMMGFSIPIYFPVCWYALTPGICIFIAIFFWTTFEPLSYGGFTYPSWTEYVGWGLSASSCVCIPIAAIFTLSKYRDNLQEAITPIIAKHQIHETTEEPFKIRGTVGSEKYMERQAGSYNLNPQTPM